MTSAKPLTEAEERAYRESGGLMPDEERLFATLDAVRAERDRLREALERIAGNGPRYTWNEAEQIAHAALEGR